MMKKFLKQSAFPLKHFFTTLLIGAVFLIYFDPSNFFRESNIMGWIMLWLIAVGVGLALALPTFVIYYVVYRIIIQKPISAILIKVVLNAVAIVGLCTTIAIYQGGFSLNPMYGYYIAAIIISSLFYRIKPTAAVTGSV